VIASIISRNGALRPERIEFARLLNRRPRSTSDGVSNALLHLEAGSDGLDRGPESCWGKREPFHHPVINKSDNGVPLSQSLEAN
jgi:hypothetical protein